MKTITPTDAHRKAMQARGDSFAQFSRNGVWGTCTDCPRDSAGKAYPEFCEQGTRHDHQLTLGDLVYAYQAHSR